MPITASGLPPTYEASLSRLASAETAATGGGSMTRTEFHRRLAAIAASQEQYQDRSSLELWRSLPEQKPPDQIPFPPKKDWRTHVEERAKKIWAREGQVPGQDLDNWVRAEQEIAAEDEGLKLKRIQRRAFELWDRQGGCSKGTLNFSYFVKNGLAEFVKSSPWLRIAYALPDQRCH
jgi:hypothetical protein